ncbi:MAG: PEP-CTERM sorting domain-containing protein [Planctomycetota bacterium]|nr:PEP-CTERM sorting domain-containing protein [Planctomycetota bacterium]
MKGYNPIGRLGVMAAILMTMGVLLSPAYCQLPGVTLLLQQSPAQGGTVIPSPGVYDFAPNSEVTLTAIPKSGYHFDYWLGDVTDPTSSTTTALLNKPKIIIAVFEQTEYNTLIVGASAGASASGTRHGGGSFGGSVAIDSSPPPSPPDNPPGPPDNPPKEYAPEPPPEPPMPPEPPIPPEPPQPPVPEPATGLLLALGGGLALLKRRSA